MIDLSYLTEEEQERILTVLKRDAELKYNEEQRINKLQKTEQDKHKLKYLTGEWFYETKLNRHGDKLHGSDIIRASMTRRKPVTIMELTQIWPGNSSFLKNESKDIFIPPELSGLIGVPSSSAHETRDHHYQAAEHNPSACSRTKPRQNPFNREHLGLESSSNTNGHLQTGITIERISENSDVVPAGHQPEVEYLLPSLKLCQAPQILAEVGGMEIIQSESFPCTHPHNDHEDLAEPQSSRVCELSGTLVEQGKVNRLSPAGPSHALSEEDDGSISTHSSILLMKSRPNAKRNERPGVQEEQNKDRLGGHGTEIKANSSPKLYLSLPELFLRRNTQVETSENVQSKDALHDGCRFQDEQDDTILGCSPQIFTSGPSFMKEEFKANPSISMINNIAGDDIQRRKVLYQDAQNQLDSLLSFWESTDKGPKESNIKKSELKKNKVTEQKISKLEFNLSPSKIKTFEYTSMHVPCKGFSGSPKSTRHDDISSIGRRVSQDRRLKIRSTSESSPIKQMVGIPRHKPQEIYTPALSVRMGITEPDTLNDPESGSEGEKGNPKKIISTDAYMPKQEVVNISSGPNQVEGNERCRSSFNSDLVEFRTKSQKNLRQSSSRVFVNEPPDDADTKSYSRTPSSMPMLDPDESNNFNPVSYPIRNIIQVSQDHSEQSTAETVKTLEPTTPLRPKHTSNTLSRRLYSGKEYRMVGSPLIAFPIDINPTQEETPLKGLEHTHTGRTKYPHELSSSGKNKKLLVDGAESHLLSLPDKQHQLISTTPPSCVGRPLAPLSICIDHIKSKQASQSVSKSETSLQLSKSPESHQKAATKRSVKDTEDARPVRLTEQKQQDDLQYRLPHTRSYVHPSCPHPHPLSLVKSTWFSEQNTPSHQSQTESEITFDSSSSISAEAWSLSWSSSSCEH